MRLGRVRVGTRFVFENRGGLWEKTAEGKARCFFGKRDEFGTEIDIGKDDYVFALFDRPEPAREREFERVPERSQELARDGKGMKVVVLDEDGQVLLEVPDAGAAKVAAFAASENIQLKPDRKRFYRNYLVCETYFRPADDSLCVEVREESVVGRDDKDEEPARPAPVKAAPVKAVPPKVKVMAPPVKVQEGPTGEARPVEVPKYEGPSGANGITEASSGPTGPVGPGPGPVGPTSAVPCPTGELVPPWPLTAEEKVKMDEMKKDFIALSSPESVAPSAMLGGTEGKATV